MHLFYPSIYLSVLSIFLSIYPVYLSTKPTYLPGPVVLLYHASDVKDGFIEALLYEGTTLRCIASDAAAVIVVGVGRVGGGIIVTVLPLPNHPRPSNTNSLISTTIVVAAAAAIVVERRVCVGMGVVVGGVGLEFLGGLGTN